MADQELTRVAVSAELLERLKPYQQATGATLTWCINKSLQDFLAGHAAALLSMLDTLGKKEPISQIEMPPVSYGRRAGGR